MKESYKFAISVVASLGLGIAAAVAYAHPGPMGGGMGPGMMRGMMTRMAMGPRGPQAAGSPAPASRTPDTTEHSH
mgnify:CR=1 FL=1